MKRYLLAYDSECGPCKRFRRLVAWFDRYHRVDYISLIKADALGLLDATDPALRRRSFHLVSPSGQISSGAPAIPDLLAVFPVGSFAAELIRSVPHGQDTVNFLYATMSRLHDKGSCNPISLPDV